MPFSPDEDKETLTKENTFKFLNFKKCIGSLKSYSYFCMCFLILLVKGFQCLKRFMSESN